MPNNNAVIISIIKPYQRFSDPISQYEIADEYKLRWGESITPRRVRLIIEDLIEEGYPIISTPHNPGGYCWKGADGEALECYKRLRRKAAKEFKRARHVLMNMYKGQLSLFDIRKKTKEIKQINDPKRFYSNKK